MKRLSLSLLLLVAGSLLLASCNTVEGFGKDVKKAGQELEEAAHK